MKISINILHTFLILYLINLTKAELCPADDYISISALGKCEKIKDILENKSLSIETMHLFYLAVNDKGKIKKNGYELDIYKLSDTKLQSHKMRKSKLYFPNTCLEKMENDDQIKLDKNAGIIIIVHDNNNLNANNIPDTYFIIRHNSPNTRINYINSKTFDFSFCHEDPILLDDEIKLEDLKYADDANKPIDMDKILYGRKLGIDLFDPYSDFLNDICFKFKSEKGSDVTLESRVEDYFQNISFCDDRANSHYISYNYSETKKTFTFRCAFGFYKNQADKSSYLDIIENELNSFVSVSNVKIINCYKNFLNLKDIIKNYGGMLCIVVLIIQLICFLIFCFCGIKPIETQLSDLFVLGRAIVKRLSLVTGIHLSGNLGNQTNNNNFKLPGKKFNLWGQIKILKQKNKLKLREKRIPEIRINNSNPPKKIISSDYDKNRERDSEEIKIKFAEPNENIFQIENGQKKEINALVDYTRNKADGENSNNTKISNTIYKTKTQKNIQEDEKSENSQLYNYENDELNDLPFEKALKYDKRSFCKYYGYILLSSHIILNVLFIHNDYNLFVVKLGLLFMTFPINLTMNIFFYTSKSIKLNYMNALDDISTFWNNIDNSIYSSLLSTCFLIILKFICLTHGSVRALRTMRDVDKAQNKSICILRCIKIRITIYFILSFIFLIIFGFYVLCFCSVYENTQIELIKLTFTSWLISLIYPFIICFFTSIIRAIALKKQSGCFYKIKKILQLF